MLDIPSMQAAWKDGSGPDGEVYTTHTQLGELIFGIIVAADMKGSFAMTPRHANFSFHPRVSHIPWDVPSFLLTVSLPWPPSCSVSEECGLCSWLGHARQASTRIYWRESSAPDRLWHQPILPLLCGTCPQMGVSELSLLMILASICLYPECWCLMFFQG